MFRVLLVCAAYSYRGKDGSVVKYSGGKKTREPLGIVALGTFLRSKGIEVKLIDLDVEDCDISEEIDNFSPAVLGVSSSVLTFESAREVISEAKKKGVFSVLGGHHTKEEAREALLKSGADAAVMGEGEISFLQICRRVEKGADWRAVPGICWEKNGSTAVFSKGRKRASEIESFPFPDRTLLSKRTTSYCLPEEKPGVRTYVIASRGCPYSCPYCPGWQVHGERWISRSVKNVLSEISELVRLGYSKVDFIDDIFGMDRKWMLAFCREMVSSGLSEKISWRCQRRVDLVDAKLLSWMKRAGCELISYGAESGSQKVLDRMRKGITVSQTIDAVRLTKDAGIRAHIHIILGYFGETLDDLALTKKLLLDADPDSFNSSFFRPFFGTPAYYEAVDAGFIGKKEIFLVQEPSTQTLPYGNGIVSQEELVRERRRMRWEFWMRPSKFIQALREGVSPRLLAQRASNFSEFFFAQTPFKIR